MCQVLEGHERLVGGRRCCDLAVVLVKRTWAAASTHATTRSTAPLKRTRVRSSRQGDVNRPPSGRCWMLTPAAFTGFTAVWMRCRLGGDLDRRAC
ncbi:hypothetical protein F2P79_013894 [Pimephales promelas]|nr:hypothetical protein F2P79_013894 [Pimephales promelas]